MQKITTVNELKLAIERMEYLRDTDLILLKSQFLITVECLKPVNIMKDSLKKITSCASLKSSLINAALGITSGIIAEKVIVGKSHNPITKIMGTLIKFLVTNKVVKNADEIKIIGGLVLNKIMKKKDNNGQQY